MRVGLHVGQLLQPVPGGIGRVTGILWEQLAREVELVPFAAGSRRSHENLIGEIASDAPLQRVGPPWRRGQYELWHRLRRPSVDLDLDVCHAPSLAIPPVRVPLVVTVNDVAFRRHPQMFTKHGVRFHEYGLKVARREAAAIIVPSQHTHDELVDIGIDAARIHRVPLGVPEPPALDPERASDRVRRLGVTGPFVLVVGTIEPRKGHRALARAHQVVRDRHPDLSLVVAGSRGWLARDLLSELSAPGIVVLDRVTDRDLEALYQRATIVATMPTYEGFGLPLLESLARGCAVVASDIPSHREIAGCAARLVAPAEIDAIVAAFEELLDSPASRRTLSEAATAAAARFTIDTMVRGHLDVYRSASCAIDRPTIGW